MTVILLGGNPRPSEASAARTRSRDSATALSGSPTTVNAGNPEAIVTWVSTSMDLDPVKRDGPHLRDHALTILQAMVEFSRIGSTTPARPRRIDEKAQTPRTVPDDAWQILAVFAVFAANYQPARS